MPGGERFRADADRQQLLLKQRLDDRGGSAATGPRDGRRRRAPGTGGACCPRRSRSRTIRAASNIACRVALQRRGSCRFRTSADFPADAAVEAEDKRRCAAGGVFALRHPLDEVGKQLVADPMEVQRHATLGALDERHQTAEASRHPIHELAGRTDSRRQQHHAHVCRQQRKSELPHDAALRFIKIVELIHHDGTDMIEAKDVRMQQAIEQHLGHDDENRRIGVDCPMARHEADRLARVAPALDGILQFDQLLIGEGDQRRRVIHARAGAESFIDGRLGDEGFARARRRRQQDAAVTRGPCVHCLFLHRVRRVWQTLEVIEDDFLTCDHAQIVPDGGYSDVMFSLRSVSKSYDGVAAIRDVSLDTPAGKTTALIGPSGCGKSTILSLMAGLIRPDAGEVLFENASTAPARWPAIRRRIGYVIQDGGLFPHLTGGANVTLMARHVGWTASDIDSRVEELSTLARLTPALLRRYPAEMSGGQRQRVALMRALMLRPDVLLLDEPLAALDPMVRAELQDDLAAIFERLGQTVVIVTHDLNEAAFFGDEIILLRDGQIAQRGTADDLFHRPADAFVTRFIRAQQARAQIGAGVS